jgi:hypothetical protein
MSEGASIREAPGGRLYTVASSAMLGFVTLRTVGTSIIVRFRWQKKYLEFAAF